jgi:subtilisin-like proprotein convertase family protein
MSLFAGFLLWHQVHECAAPRPTLPPPLTHHASRITPTPPQAASTPQNLRLSNTTTPLDRLARSEHAILLANAWLDTAQLSQNSSARPGLASIDSPLPIPAHLRAQGDPGAYVIQSRAPLDDAFRALLQAAGATVVSYIPNNAYLVRASAAAAQQVAADPRAQAVLPYEPYYKLQSPLLGSAVTQTPLPEGCALDVLLFPDARAAASAGLKDLGLQILGEEPSPFGPVLKVRAAADATGQTAAADSAAILCALARLPAVQQIALSRHRVMASDLSRARVAVATDSVTPDNYLGLTGTNVLVNVNDSGVDASHPDLTNRVFSDLPINGTDTNGHGTHIAGIIAGSGLESPTVTNASGSVMPAVDSQFRGFAPAARLFVMAAGPDADPSSSNSYLQETAARTNAFISNNSWGYDDDNAYDLAAASYDAAVRDALPGVPGAQPLLFVFAAGNTGKGADDGLGGIAGSVMSPGTAKNVITVGAIEQPRAIADEAWQCALVDGTNVCWTNRPWLGITSTNNEVAGFSGRGNVGAGIEGVFGRFKPDVVAPGAFVVAARSTQWDQAAYYRPAKDSNYFEVLSNINNTIGPFYRYESGTSMSAAEVSGTLALMQEFFQRLSRTNSPALMKALLINGARSLGARYDFQVSALTNYQGWGLINLTNSLPGPLTNPVPAASPMLLFDQEPDDSLDTGQSRTRFVTLADAATHQPLRVTLAWTDPPGNPAASLKLVNNLDLVVTNLATGEVFFGNDFPAGGSFSVPWDTLSPPNLDVVNNVENVYLAPPLGAAYSFTVIARGVNVNAVAAQATNVAQDCALVISSGDGAVADALTLTDAPIASATSSNVMFLTNAFAAGSGISGALLVNQRAGANPPLLDVGSIPWPAGSNGLIAPGTLSQWRFYVLTNDQAYTNAAFVTFRPDRLSVPSVNVNVTNLAGAVGLGADIDLYVSTNPALTTLDPAAIAGADKSLRRGGTEMLVFSNAAPGTYYVGIKAEDQPAAEYVFMGVFGLLPFSTQDADGSWILHGINLPAAIPDGSADRPGTTNVVALAPAPIPVRRVVVTNELWHERFSDLLVTLTHGRTSVVLHSNSLPPVDPVPLQYTWIYEDNGQGDIPGAQRSDGPGSLCSFIGDQGMGVWLLTVADHVPTHTGLVANVTLRIEPQDVSNGAPREVATNAFASDFMDVPIGATNLTVCIGNESPALLPLTLYLRRGSPPTLGLWDQMAVLSPTGGCLSLNRCALPPLNPGRYFIGVFNPNDIPQTIRMNATVDVDPAPAVPATYAVAGPIPILDNAVTNASLFVPVSQPIASVGVRLHVDHPRVSDMAFTLISPGGTRVLLFENRGGATTNGLGGIVLSTNVFPTRTSGDYNANTNVLNVGRNQGTLFVDYDFYQAPDTMTVYYDGGVIYDSGLISSNGQVTIPFGPGVSTNLVIIMNETNNYDTNSLWEYTATVACPMPGYLSFTENANRTRVPVKFAPLPFVPAGTNTDLYYLPEESLNALAGQNAFGQWQLEMWDSRAGAFDPAPQLVTWQLQFVFQDTIPVPIGLTCANACSNTVPPGQVAPFFLDVPAWATRVTNILLNASAPVNLLFNQVRPPTGTNAGDATLLSRSTAGSATLGIGGSPPLIPGARYYLGIQNTGTSNAIAVVQAVFDISVNSLTNGITSFAANSGAGDATDYYLYTVSSNAVRAQFEINGPTADMTLVARKGLPPPTLTNYTYISANPGPNDELIVLFDSSSPVPLGPGDWYISAVNVSGEAVTYGIRATEFSEYGTNIVITNCQISGDSLYLAWNSLPDIKYYVQGRTDIGSTNWTPVSATITAADTFTTFRLALPSPYHFFRVHEGLVLNPWLPPVRIASITSGTDGVLLEWSTPGSNHFRVQWSDSLVPPAWNTFTNVVAPTNGAASFRDDGSQSGGLGDLRYYRLQELP